MTQQRPIPLRALYEGPSAKHFVRATFALFMKTARSGNNDDADEHCKSIFPDDEVSPLLLAHTSTTVQRAAAAPGSTTGWASQLAQQTTLKFLASLAPQSAASKLIELGLSASLDGYASMSLPYRASSPQSMPWVGEGSPIPVRNAMLSAYPIAPRKMGAIIVLSRELSKRSGAQAIFEAILREDVAVSLDAGYFSADAGSVTAHPGLLYGAPAVVTTGDMQKDLAALAAAVGAGGSGQVVFITGPGLAAAIGILMPDMKNLVLASLAVSETRIVAVDPLSLYHCIDGDPDIDASESAVFHMDSEPMQISAPLAAPVLSTFQVAAIAVRCLIDVAFGVRRSGAVAYMDVEGWSA